VQELRQQYPLAGLLKLAKLPRSTFYYQQDVLRGGDKHKQLKEQIRTVFNRHRGRYGYRRVQQRCAKWASWSTISECRV
jgi:putative transposase